jgi:hypothetical protein
VKLDLPDKFVLISDDTEAQAFLMATGILDKLPNPSTRPDTQTTMCADYSHPSHWILATRIQGNADPTENGFMVMAWPKCKWPRSVIKEAIERQRLGHPNDVRLFYDEDDAHSLS